MMTRLWRRGEVAEGGHVGGDAEGVDDEDGAGSRGEDAFDRGGREVEGDGIDVGEDRCGADVQDGVGDGDEGEGRDDDFIAFSDAEGEQGHVQACGAAADGDGVGDGVVCGKGGFERGEFGAEAEMGCAQDGGDGGDFGFGDVGEAERDGRIQIRVLDLAVSELAVLRTCSQVSERCRPVSGAGCLMRRLSSGTVARTRAMVLAAVPLP